MPKQIFIITRAPEVRPITAEELRLFLYRSRRDTEWEVMEINREDGQVMHD